MAAKEKEPEPTTEDLERAEAMAKRKGAIAGTVLVELGRIPGLCSIDVNHLWLDRFRVNVWVDLGEGKKIARSYFVLDLPDGRVFSPQLET